MVISNQGRKLHWGVDSHPVLNLYFVTGFYNYIFRIVFSYGRNTEWDALVGRLEYLGCSRF